MCASDDDLGDVTRITQTAVGDYRNAAAFECGDDIVDRRHLRHPDPGNDAGGADRAWADTDFDRVRTRLDQRLGRRAGGDVAADHLHLREVLFDPGDAVEHTDRMTVSGVDRDDVDAGVHQQLDALFSAFAGTDGSTNAQTLLRIAAGIGKIGGFLNVLYGNQAAQLEVVVDHQDLFDPVLVQLGDHLFAAGALRHRHQAIFGRHDRTDFLVQARLEAQIAAGYDADQLAAIHHRHAGDMVGTGQFEDLADTGVG